jgi:hypothetical protein
MISIEPHSVPSAPADVVVLTWQAPTDSDRRAREITEFLGASATFIPIGAAGSDQTLRRARAACLIVDAETLAIAADAADDDSSWLRLLTAGLAKNIFVYGFRGSERHSAVLRTLTGGRLRDAQPVAGSEHRFDVSSTHRDWCEQFTSVSFDAPGAAGDCAFEASDAVERDVLVWIDGQPFFVGLFGAEIRFFLVAGQLADLDEIVGRAGRDCSVLSRFSTTIPLMMFLRGTLGRRIWTNAQPRACFMVDDPFLQKRYGFLDYERLIDSMRRRRFSTCIAFIPWNYRRFDKSVAALVTERGTPGLCVHGCDHTRGEYATNDAALLAGKSQLALERMQAHQRDSGVPFDDVMVFPQGLFSVEAMSALSAAGYLAAINSDLFASTGESPALTLRDLLDVAVTKYAGFPLFGRRYPKVLAEFAFDLFVGKPALAVEHHGFFRHGYAALEAFVDQLQALDDRIEWTSVGAICRQTSVSRTEPDGVVSVRFYTNRFQLTNTAAHEQVYRLHGPRQSDDFRAAVTVNGKPWSGENVNHQPVIQMSLGPGESAHIVLVPDASKSVTAAWKSTPVHAASVAIRRRLCDLRDNHVETNRVLSAVLNGLAAV